MSVTVVKGGTHHNGHASARTLLRKDKLEVRGADVVFENELLRVTSQGDPDAPGVFVCFTGTQLAMGGIDAEEFVGSTRLPGFSALFVSDLSRSWFNAFPPEMLVDAVAERIEGKRVITLGNSMGGYGAIWASKYLPAETAIAFAPQFAMSAAAMPGEKRWRKFRKSIKQWRHESLADHFRDEVRYVTINGDEPLDRQHWNQLPQGPNMEHLLVAGTQHFPAAHFKKAGILGEVIALCTEGSSPEPLIRETGFEVTRIGGGNA